MALALVHCADTAVLCHTSDPAFDTPSDPGEWVPAPDPLPEGVTTVTVRPLSGWEMMRARQLQSEDDPTPFVREVLRIGLLEIDGDKDKARAFVNAPTSEWLFAVFNAVSDAGARPTVGRASS